MANLNQAMGLVPLRRKDDAATINSGTVYYIPANTANAVYIGDPVVRLDGPTSNSGVGAVGLAAANGVVTGVVVGFEGRAAANSALTPSLRGGMPGNIYRPASTTLDYYAIVDDSPETLYSVTVDGTNTLPTTAIGKTAALLPGTGNQITGSGWTLNSSTTGTSAAQVQIVGLAQTVQNDPTQPYARFLVRINKNTEVNGTPGV